MKRTKIVKRVGRTYAFGKMRSGDIIELLELFQTKNIFMEVIKIETDSRFYKSIEEKQEENVIFSCPPTERYTDIFIPVCSREGLAERIDEIIDNDPEMLIFDLTNLSLEEFLRFDRKRYADKMITKGISICAFEIMFDENVFSITFSSELPDRSGLLSRMDEIFCRLQD